MDRREQTMRFLGSPWRYLSPDDGAGSGDGNTPPPDDKKNEETHKKEEEQPKPKGEEKKFSQADVNKFIQNRLKEEKEKNEREAAEKQGEFQKLYDGLKPKYEQAETELNSLKTELQETQTSVHKMLDSLIKDWPAEVKALDPGISSLKARQEWIEKSQPLVEKLTGKPKAPNLEQGKGNSDGGNKSVSIGSDYVSKRYGISKK